jgi:hypothetical protein
MDRLKAWTVFDDSTSHMYDRHAKIDAELKKAEYIVSSGALNEDSASAVQTSIELITDSLLDENEELQQLLQQRSTLDPLNEPKRSYKESDKSYQTLLARLKALRAAVQVQQPAGTSAIKPPVTHRARQPRTGRGTPDSIVPDDPTSYELVVGEMDDAEALAVAAGTDGGQPARWRRVLRAALPLQAMMILMLGAACLIPHCDDSYTCQLANNFVNGLQPVLDHVDGMPPM